MRAKIGPGSSNFEAVIAEHLTAEHFYKFDKQFKYADKKQIPYAVMIGSKELSENVLVLKNLITGVQETLSSEGLLAFAF